MFLFIVPLDLKFGWEPYSTFKSAITKTKESEAHGENAEADDGFALRHFHHVSTVAPQIGVWPERWDMYIKIILDFAILGRERRGETSVSYMFGFESTQVVETMRKDNARTSSFRQWFRDWLACVTSGVYVVLSSGFDLILCRWIWSGHSHPKTGCTKRRMPAPYL